MNYHVISTGNGTGGIFTSKANAMEFMKTHSGTYRVMDHLPDRIPPKDAFRPEPDVEPVVPTTVKDLVGPLTIYTDGSCHGNPGPGGYGVVIKDESPASMLELSQGFSRTTSNRMELMAVITVLETIPDLSTTIHSDSAYVISSINQGWAKGWRAKGWLKRDGKPALNTDLWERLLNLMENFNDLTFRHVKGHSGNSLNEKADSLANSAADSDNLIGDIGYGSKD